MGVIAIVRRLWLLDAIVFWCSGCGELFACVACATSKMRDPVERVELELEATPDEVLTQSCFK